MTEEPKLMSPAEMKASGMSAPEILDAWRGRPLSSRVGSRSLRRKAVISIYGSYVLLALSLEVTFQMRGQWISAALGVLAIGAVVIATWSVAWLGRRTYVNSPQLADRELDERLVQVKNQAYRTAFQIFSVFVAIAWPVSLLLVTIGPGGQGTARALLILCALPLMITTLPTAIVAWREPDPQP